MGLVQQATNSAAGSAATIAATFSVTPTAGNTLVVIVNNRSLHPVNSISITNGTGPVRLAHNTFSSISTASEIWAIIAGVSSGTVFTVNFSATSVARSVSISEWSGLAAVVTGDSTFVTTSAASGSTSLSTGAYSAAVAGDLVLCCAVIAAAATFSSDPSSPYTSFTAPEAPFHCSYNFGASSGSQPAASWAFSSSFAQTLIVAIQPPGVAAGLFQPSLLNGVTTGGPFFADPIS